jgi:hypothetical protein
MEIQTCFLSACSELPEFSELILISIMLSTHIPVYHGKAKVTVKLYAWVINGKLRCATLSTDIGLMSRFLFLNVV